MLLPHPTKEPDILTFHQALHEKNDEAWLLIHNRYQTLFCHWIRTALPRLSEPDVEDILQISYLKLLKTVHANQIDIQKQFEHIGSILKYLKKCIISVSYDHARKLKQQSRLEETLKVIKEQNDLFIDTVVQSELKEIIDAWFDSFIQDPIEQKTIRLLFHENLKPSEIVKACPDEFISSKEVYRIRERVMKRAKKELPNLDYM